MVQDSYSKFTSAFSMAYEGEALTRHTMPVRDLAPALLAMAQAFERANAILNGGRAEVALDIQATERGSFEVHLVLQQLFQQASSSLSDDFISTAANLKELIIGGSGAMGGLIYLIKHFKGAKAKEVARAGNAVVLEAKSLKLTVPTEMAQLYKDRSLVEQLGAVVQPLTRSGMDRLLFREPNKVIETIDKNDVGSFDLHEDGEDNKSESVIPRQLLKLVSPNFQDGKWKLTDGEKTRWYTIGDRDFVREVQQGTRSFRCGDILVCQVVLRQSVDSEGNLHLEHHISDVLRHEYRPTQLRFDGDGKTHYADGH